MSEELTVRESAPQVDTAVLAALNKAELDQQITTARAFPRSIRHFVNEATDLVTLSAEVAEGCIYAVPRDKKIIRGPSARFAEVLVSRYRNCRAGARVIAEDENFVIAQGVFHDLETNSATTYEVRRRIVDSRGRRYNVDMIGTTANAACSIALRQAVLKGIPKALWQSIYDGAEQTLAGGNKPLTERRDAALGYFGKIGVSPERVYARLEVGGYEDLGSDELLTLHGLRMAIKEGELSLEGAFPLTAAPDPAGAAPAGLAGLRSKLGEGKAAPEAPPPPTAATVAPETAPEAGSAAAAAAGAAELGAAIAATATPIASGEQPGTRETDPTRALMEDPDGNLVDVETGEIVTRAEDRKPKGKGKGK